MIVGTRTVSSEQHQQQGRQQPQVPTRAAIAFGNSSWSRVQQQQTASAPWLINHLRAPVQPVPSLFWAPARTAAASASQWSRQPLLCPCSWQHQQSRLYVAREGQAGMDVCSSSSNNDDNTNRQQSLASHAAAAGQATTFSPNKSSHCLRHQQLEQSATAATVSAAWLIISHLYSQSPSLYWAPAAQLQLLPAVELPPCCVRAAGSTSRAAVVHGKAGQHQCLQQQQQ